MRQRFSLLLACGAAALVPAAVAGTRRSGSPPLLAGTRCPVLPADSPWNQRVDRLPAAHDSSAVIHVIGGADPVHPDFGAVYNGAPNGVPYAIVSRRTRRVPVSFDYAGESDRGRYPLPQHVPIEGGPRSTGDRHVIVVNRDTCTDYELFAAYPRAGGRWHAGSGAIFNLRSDRLRPAGWTSADAAGLPILPGLARYDEVARGVINHALRFTVSCTAYAYVYPARHRTSGCSKAHAPPMGLRLRLRASVNISRLPHQARVVAQALERYGMFVADNGASWFISGAPDRRWKDDDLHLLGLLKGRDFEVVDTRSLPNPAR